MQNIICRRHGKYENLDESRRQVTFESIVPNGQGENVQACSSTFKEISAVSLSKLQTLQENNKKKSSVVYKDSREKHPNSNGKKKRNSLKMIETWFGIIYIVSPDMKASIVEKRLPESF